MYYGALNHFVFNTISTQTAGTAFSITITAKDAYGNTVTSYDSSTTLTETGGGAGGAVSTSPVTFTNGVYTGNVYVTKSGTGVTITATHGSTSSASNTFTVNPGALSTFVFNTISTQTAGTAFSITITAKDAYGNTVTSYASSVGLSSSTGIGTITPTSIGTSGWLNGVWSGSVKLTTASSRVTVTANDGSGHTGTSNPFTVRSH
jgi:FKBP-type peptidyl-prolyl cis-trans isomerase 2